MTRKIALSLGALMAMSVAPAAVMASVCPDGGEISGTQYGVCVTIVVPPQVAVWSSHDALTLTMDGQDGNNAAVFPSALGYISNVAGDITAGVEGVFPPPVVGNVGILFYIFWDTNDETLVRAAITNIAKPGAGGPAAFGNVNGGLVWAHDSGDSGGSLGTVPLSASAAGVPIMYASSSPFEVPAVNAGFELAVTYTIAPN